MNLVTAREIKHSSELAAKTKKARGSRGSNAEKALTKKINNVQCPADLQLSRRGGIQIQLASERCSQEPHARTSPSLKGGRSGREGVWSIKQTRRQSSVQNKEVSKKNKKTVSTLPASESGNKTIRKKEKGNPRMGGTSSEVDPVGRKGSERRGDRTCPKGGRRAPGVQNQITYRHE